MTKFEWFVAIELAVLIWVVAQVQDILMKVRKDLGGLKSELQDIHAAVVDLKPDDPNDD